MTAIRVAVYQSDGATFLANVPRRRNVKWQDEVNSPGSASFDIHLDDDVVQMHPDLLTEYNVVKFYLNGTAVKAWIIEDVSPVRVNNAGPSGRWVTVSGRGPAAALEAAVVYPEYGLRDLVSEDRAFNFASADGVWRVPTEWVTPAGVAFSASTALRGGYPKDWPDPAAQWLWSSNPSAGSPPGPNWFRSTLNLAANTPVIIYATADNQLESLYIDGEMVATSNDSTAAFRQSYIWRMTLAAGDHTIAAKAINLGGSPNPAGFIATIYRTDATGARTTDNVWRSSTVNTQVKAYGSAPGWNGATILQQLVLEAQDRAVDALLPVTFSFTNLVDSAGVPWDDIQDRVVKVGTTDLADLATQVIELSLDLEIDANFVMNAWKRRGTDRSATIIIQPDRDTTAAAGSIRGSRVRNQALLKYDGGWMELFSAESKTTYGRREVGLSIGTSTSTDQTQLAGQSALREVVMPETTIPLAYTSAKGPQPYTSFNLGDTLTVPGIITGLTKGRLMSISGSEVGEGDVVQWDLDFYPDVDDSAITTIVTATGGAYNDISTLYAHEVLSDSPWGYWRMSETSGPFLDSSGHGRSMFIVGTPSRNLAGPVARAAGFDTTDEYARTDSAHEYSLSTITVEAWVYIASYPTSNWSAIIAASDVAGGLHHDKELYLDTAGRLSFRAWYNNAGRVVTYSTPLARNTWHHVAGSVGARGLRLYRNGAVVASNMTALGSEGKPTKRIYIRGGGSGFDNRDNIQIAEAAVYWWQLIDSRLASHYRAAQYTP